MAKTLENMIYDKVKILHKLSSLLWFVEKHAKDAAHDAAYKTYLDNLSNDLEKYVQELKNMTFK